MSEKSRLNGGDLFAMQGDVVLAPHANDGRLPVTCQHGSGNQWVVVVPISDAHDGKLPVTCQQG